MNRYLRFAFAATISLAAFAQQSCKLNDYCLECEKGDGGHTGDGGSDAPPDTMIDAGDCVPTGDEICDGKDNDCDGLVDEGVLPEVGDLCANQNGECAGGTKICAPTFHCSVTVAQACSDASAVTCPQGETCKADGKSTDHIACNKNPSPESCDGKDNNCNGMIDEGDPNGGGRCGNGTGTCVQGVLHCTGTCVGMADTCTGGTADSVTCEGGVGPSTEVCDGLDNNCDGFIDNGVPTGGSCGTSNVGACKQGIVACIGGGTVCSGHCSATTGQPCGSGLPACPGAETCVTPVNPTLETCNSADDDCDGSTDEDFKGGHCSTATTQACGAGLAACPGAQTCVGNTTFDLSPQNCGGCGMVCGTGLPNSGNALWACSGSGTCVISSCKSGYHDNDGDPSNGCEFGVCFNSGPEVCDGVDNDCDGVIDETGSIGAAPGICATLGECKGAVATCPCKDTPDTNCTNGGSCVTSCSNTGGWECNYPATVTVTNGVIQPETKCDNLDNDCNGIIDDSQVQIEHADCPGYVPGNASSCPATPVTCSNGQLGACSRGGAFQCNAADLNGAAICNAVDGSSSKVAETCNNIDDDCDGVTDEGGGAGGLSGQTWIEIGGGHQMMQFEASRPDALTANVASVATCTGNTLGASTTIAAGSNGMTLPQATINVGNTLDFTTALQITVVTASGSQNVTCTGKTATTFTGCSGGAGAMSTGGAVGQLTVSESATTGTYNTTNPHGLVVGERVVISGVGIAGYNGTFFVATVPSATSFTITGLTAGLNPSGGGLVSSHCPMTSVTATESGYIATFTTPSAHGLAVGTAVIISGMSVAGYNGTWVILTTTSTTFTVQLTTAGLGAGSGGTVATNGISTCSQSLVQPWTDVTYPQALAACQSIGATLCSDSEWHRACSANGSAGNNRPTVYPVSTGGAGLLIEAEDYFNVSYGVDASGNIKSWVEDQTPGFFGISDMVAQPNTGISITSANAPTQSPRLDYQITFTAAAATYHACVHMFSPGHCSADATKSCSVNGDCTTGTCLSSDDQVFVGLNASLPGTVTGTALQTTSKNVWQWIQSPALNATGTQFLSLYMATDGVKVDAIYILNGACPGTLTNASEAGVVDSPGFKWAMQPATTPPSNYTAQNCNDQNYTGAGAGGPLNSGALTSCYASDDGLKSGTSGVKAFDMSGNVREWAFAHQPGQNPVRGGAYNDTSPGISCPNDFLLADDKFLLPNVGFRCCR